MAGLVGSLPQLAANWGSWVSPASTPHSLIQCDRCASSELMSAPELANLPILDSTLDWRRRKKMVENFLLNWDLTSYSSFTTFTSFTSSLDVFVEIGVYLPPFVVLVLTDLGWDGAFPWLTTLAVGWVVAARLTPHCTQLTLPLHYSLEWRMCNAVYCSAV